VCVLRTMSACSCCHALCSAPEPLPPARQRRGAGRHASARAARRVRRARHSRGARHRAGRARAEGASLRACGLLLCCATVFTRRLACAPPQDGMREHWPEALVAQLVGSATCATQAHAVLTFDAHGVSGHANHVATHRGVVAWGRAQRRSADCWLLVRGLRASAVPRPCGLLCG
jgi:LmbE family N-acetylglucosaminyl deacetylase